MALRQENPAEVLRRIRQEREERPVLPPEETIFRIQEERAQQMADEERELSRVFGAYESIDPRDFPNAFTGYPSAFRRTPGMEETEEWLRQNADVPFSLKAGAFPVKFLAETRVPVIGGSIPELAVGLGGGFTAAKTVGLPLAKALTERFGKKFAQTFLGRVARSAAVEIPAGIGAGVAGGGAGAIERGENVLEGMGYGGLAGGALGATVSLGIPALGVGASQAARGLAVARRGVLRENMDAVYRAVEKGIIPEVKRVFPEHAWTVFREAAENMGVSPQDYVRIAHEIAPEMAALPEAAVVHIRKALWNYIPKEPAVPWFGQAVSRRLTAVKEAQNLLPKSLKAINESPAALGRWIGEKVMPYAKRIGIASPEAAHFAQTTLREMHGEETYWKMLATRDVFGALEEMPPDARRRAGELLANYIEKTPTGPRVRKQGVELSQLAPEERERAIEEFGRRLAQEGDVTLGDQVTAIRMDDVLTKDQKATTIAIRAIINDLEDLGIETGAKNFVGSGLYRFRLWEEKALKDAAERGLPISEPRRMRIKGVAKQHRTQSILELDQGQGGAWWLTKGTGKAQQVFERFKDPAQAIDRLAEMLELPKSDVRTYLNSRALGTKESAMPGNVRVVGRRMQGLDLDYVRPMPYAEAEAQGLIVEAGFPEAVRLWEVANDITKQRFFRSVAGHPELTRKPIAGAELPPGYMEIPKHESYGTLQGQWVHRRVGEHILDVVEADETMWKALMDGWRFARLAGNPATHFRNIFTDIMFANHPSVGLSLFSPRTVEHLGKAVEAYTGNGIFKQLAIRHGVIGGEFTNTAARIWKGYLEEMRKGKGPLDALNTLKEATSVSADVYAAEDQIFALAGFRKLIIDDGLTPRAAAAKVKEAFPDFRIMHRQIPFHPTEIIGKRFRPAGGIPRGGAISMTPGESILLNPFIRFDMESLRIVKNAMKTPEGMFWLAKWYGAFPLAMTGASLAATGITLDEFLEMQRFAPKWRGNHFWSFLLPFKGKDEEGRMKPYVYDAANALPLIDLGRFGDIRLPQIAEFEDISGPGKLGLTVATKLFSHPILRSIIEGTTGVSTFTGEPLAREGEAELPARAGGVARQMLPIPGLFPGMYSYRKWVDSMMGRTKGVADIPLEAWPTTADVLFGQKVQPVFSKMEKKERRADLEGKLVPIERELESLHARFSKGKMTEKVFEDQLGRLERQRDEIIRAIRVGKPSDLEEFLNLIGASGKEK